MKKTENVQKIFCKHNELKCDRGVEKDRFYS